MPTLLRLFVNCECMITDRYDRTHDYLRISLTDNCNLRCFYCMPEEEYRFTPAPRLMQTGEVETLARIFVELGVKKIRLTGGEPLVRKDAAAIIGALSRLNVELTMTTNATRIHEFIDVLRESGIRSINVSLDTLQPERFLFVTRRDLFHRVRANIELLLHHGFQVKVNVVVMKGFNEDEITDFVAWTLHNPVSVRFIEFMPFEGNRWTANKVVPMKEILELVGNKYAYLPVENLPHDTAKHFIIPGHEGSFAVISTMSAPFCAGCNRMRLTADGKMKNCLFSNSETDLLQALRRGEDVATLIRENILGKARELGGQFHADIAHVDAGKISNRSMITIGG